MIVLQDPLDRQQVRTMLTAYMDDVKAFHAAGGNGMQRINDLFDEVEKYAATLPAETVERFTEICNQEIQAMQFAQNQEQAVVQAQQIQSAVNKNAIYSAISILLIIFIIMILSS